MSDSANTPVETKTFSQAELEVLQQRMQVYRQATASVNEWIAFLTRQHGVKEEDGWQLGETGFVREVPEPQVAKQPWREPVIVQPEKPALAGNHAR